MRKSILIFLLVVAVLTLSSCSGAQNRDENQNIDVKLPKVSGFDELVELLGQISSRGVYYGFDTRAMMETDGIQTSREMSKAGGDSYSGTNVQVQGVDEADIIKTDGEYIYYVNMNSIIILKAYPADSMSVVKRITFEEDTFYPYEIYIDDNHLIVIGNTYYYYPMPYIDMGQGDAQEGSRGTADDETKEEIKEVERLMPHYRSRDTVKVLIYDIGMPEQASLVREFETEGYYVSSRKIGSQFHLVSNKYIYLYGMDEPDEAVILPWYRDGSKDDEFEAVDYENIRYFPNSQDSSYLMITGLDLDNINDDLNVQAFLGSGHTIYASEKNLYVAYSKWEYQIMTDEARENDTSVSNDAPDRMIMPAPSQTSTIIYKFSLNSGKVSFAAEGEVPGTLLNQFSMDEHDGFFRVATTAGDAWRDDEFTSKNNLYVLNNSLEVIGRIENIAPGERIYSVRFMGDKGYMVTFKTVDPLFVLDLKEPTNPSILGELKIPGYSDYLHPYDENHIIGFGMDAIEAQITDDRGNAFGTTVYQLGMKIALFDVSDVNDPKEKFSISIGDRGTYSELLYNHKALVYSKEMNLMAFPVTIVKSPEGKPLEYGALSFQGMQLYRIDPDNGFDLLAEFSHLTQQELKNANMRGYDYTKTVERGLYIDDVFYTVSKGYITANSLVTFDEIGSVKLQ